MKANARSIQDSQSSEVLDGVFNDTEIRMVEELIQGVIDRLRSGNYD